MSNYSCEEFRVLTQTQEFADAVNRVKVILSRRYFEINDVEDALQEAITKILEGERKLLKPDSTPCTMEMLVGKLFYMTKSVLLNDLKKRKANKHVSFEVGRHGNSSNIVCMSVSVTTLLNLLNDDMRRQVARLLWDRRRELTVKEIREELGISQQAYYRIRGEIYKDICDYLERHHPSQKGK